MRGAMPEAELDAEVEAMPSEGLFSACGIR